jgi:hypothetical protein
MIQSVWQMRTTMLNRPGEKSSDTVVALPVEKLPAQSLVISPQRQIVRLSDVGEKRRSIAA